MKMKMVIVALSLVLTACGTGVKLDQAPVEDRTTNPVTPTGANADGAVKDAANQVTGVVATGAGGAGASSVLARTVYFDFDSFAIKPEFQSVIESNARLLVAERKRKVVVEGHTDELGGREYNLALGQRRAEAVRQALKLLNVEETQVEAVSFGKEKPAATGSDEAAMAKNRRAEMVLR